MILVYDRINVHAHVACGLQEEFKATEEQARQLKIVNLLIETLKQDINNFYDKMGAKNTKDLLEMADKDPEVDKQIQEWMNKVFAPQSNDIIKVVEEFNVNHAQNYDKLKAQNKGDKE